MTCIFADIVLIWDISVSYAPFLFCDLNAYTATHYVKHCQVPVKLESVVIAFFKILQHLNIKNMHTYMYIFKCTFYIRLCLICRKAWSWRHE